MAKKEFNIRNEVDKLKASGWTGFVVYEGREWRLFETRKNRTPMIALGKENVIKQIKQIKKKL